jgi:signal peptidase I
MNEDRRATESGRERGAGSGQTEAASGYKKSTVREYFESICVAVILALFIRTFVFQAFKIPTGSMENNLLIGDHLIVNKMMYSPSDSPLERAISPVRDVRRGDVVVFKFPNEPERDFIKRVIGLPGEKIRIENKTVFINGEPLDEPYVHFSDPTDISDMSFPGDRRDNMPENVVPDGELFVMGDNRDNSHDSRFWGTLSADMLKGRALMVYWSYDAPDGRDAYFKEGIDRVKELLSVFVHFFSRTRWDRFFQLVR